MNSSFNNPNCMDIHGGEAISDLISYPSYDAGSEPSFEPNYDPSCEPSFEPACKPSSESNLCISNHGGEGLHVDPSIVDSWQNLAFVSSDDAFRFYDDYAKRQGFVVRKQSQIKRDSRNGDVSFSTYLQFECNRRGNRKKKVPKDGVKLRYRSSIKCNCDAVIRFKFNPTTSCYHITLWIDKHNHPMLEHNHLQFVPRNRSINSGQEDVIDIHLNSGMSQRCIYESMSRSHGGRENLGFLRIDLKNHIRIRREKQMLPGEATVLQKWFREQAQLDPGFFYDLEVDSNEEIMGIFWADSVMRKDYTLFGDFVSFDTTYRTNKKYRPLGK